MQIANSLDYVGWVLLFLGWAIYWLKTADAYIKDKRKNSRLATFEAIGSFFSNNFIEIPTSLLTCLALAILAPYVPKELMDMQGKISIFITGYFSSSALNSLITKYKK